MSTRGIRNCNPANIRHGSKWQGRRKKQTDKEFVQFVSMVWGVRALIVTLRTYVRKHNLYSVHDIISRWAPPQDNNDTKAYINYVVNRCPYCFSPDDYYISPLSFGTRYPSERDKLYHLCEAMCMMESSYSLKRELFDEAFDLL